MKTDGYSHIKVFQEYSKEVLSQQEAGRIVADTLKLPWVKRFQVFSDQAILLVDINSSKYLYVSPSMKIISGHEPAEFTDFTFIASLMSPKEIEIAIQVSNILVAKLKTVTLKPREVLQLHSTRNVFFKRKDGTIMNTLQHGFTLMVNKEGLPIIEMLIVTDITPFNTKYEHFYSVARTHKDGAEELLLSGRIEPTDEQISPREQEVLKLICRGHSSQTIAQQLHVSPETVKTHRKNLLEKTNTKNSIDLVRYGYAHGWL